MEHLFRQESGRPEGRMKKNQGHCRNLDVANEDLSGKELMKDVKNSN
jgi:hypothetical protein